MASADTTADLAELRELFSLATRPSNKKLLTNAILAIEAASLAPVVAEPASTVSIDVAPHATGAPSRVATNATSSSAPTRTVLKWEEPSYGWTEAGDFVEILLTDERLRGVGALPADAVTCEFEKDSFDVKVVGLNGLNFRVRVAALDKDIIPAASKVVVLRNRVKLLLKKSGQYDFWTNLARKAGKKAVSDKPGGAAAGPGDGIMDMMRDMYESGDDQMKKTIGEAFMKSRSGGADGSRGGGLGSLGGLGGGGDGADDF